MSQIPAPGPAAGLRDPVARSLAAAALLCSLAALVFAMTQSAPAKPKSAGAKPGKPGGVLRLNGKGKIPLKAIPVVANARNSKRLGGARRVALTVNCPIPNAVDLGTWCLESSTFPVPPEDAGKNNYLYAAQKCVEEGGWLPSAAQLIGAASRAKLQSTIDDNPITSATEEFPDPKYGIKDGREMSGDLFTTTAGSSAAGSHGVTPGSRGNTSLGEPDPVPAPADPVPNTLNYVTVYDNHDRGGFGGGVPVGAPERFRCAYAKGFQGTKFDE